MKYKNLKKGFTLTELLIGLSIGIVVLTGLMSFYFRSSKMIGDQQTMVKDLSQLQFVMNKIVQDIKEANTEVPGTGSTVSVAQWDALPYLCYVRVWNNTKIEQPPSGYRKEIPAYPAIYPYDWQYGNAGYPDGWFPKDDPTPNPNDDITNKIVFYKVIKNQVSRVIYYCDKDPAFPSSPSPVYRLKRKQQFGITPTSILINDLNLTTTDTVILSNLNYVKFTYPILTKKLSIPGDVEYDVSQLDTNLQTELSNVDPLHDEYLQSQIMNKYRNIIKIKIATAGPQIGNKRVNGLELSTEVNVRN